MGRHHLSVRKRTTIPQRLPDDHDDKLLNFQKYVIKQTKEHNHHKMRKVTELKICQWIKDSWKELDISCIVNSFKKTCISNKLDGSEDDLLWNDEEQQSEPEQTESNNVDDDDDLFHNDLDIAQLRENDTY